MNEDLDLAIRLLNEMEYERGIEILEAVLSDNPNNEMALYNVALAYNSINEPLKAIKTFEYYLKHFPKNGNILAGLGYSFYLNHSIEKAKEVLEEAVEIDPTNIYALRNLSGILANIGDNEKAEKLFNAILALSSKDYKSILGLGIIFYERKEFDKAQDHFYQVMALPISEDAKEPAKTYLSKIAAHTLKGDGFRVDAVMYLVSAINKYNQLDIDGIKKIAFEIAAIGQNGLDINNPEKKYKVFALDGKEISGLCCICYMYAGFKIFEPNLSVGIDLILEYEQALKLVENGMM